MNRFFSLVLWAMTPAALCASILDAKAATNLDWTVGQEREVDEGIYFKLLKIADGWRLWRIDTVHGFECLAVKAAQGSAPPAPLGVGSYFTGGVPRLMLRWSSDRHGFLYEWEGKYLNDIEVKFRRPGERYWTSLDRDAAFYDGENLEVTVSTWEYPAIFLGHHEAKGLFRLTGLSEMKDALYICNPPPDAGKIPVEKTIELDRQFPND